jgi:uncharacterized cofD-like protein
MERIFQYRFTGGGEGLRGHNLGNLVIAGLVEMEGDFRAAIASASRVLAVRGRVLPSSAQPLVLRAEMEDGTIVTGETAIAAHRGRVARVVVEGSGAGGEVAALPEALEAIVEADVVVVGPGSVFTSIAANLATPGIAAALARTPALRVFVCNVMTQPGESDGMSASDHLAAVLRQLGAGNPFDFVVMNSARPDEHVLDRYATMDQTFVAPDAERVRALGSQPQAEDLLAEGELVRHDPDRLARAILGLAARYTGRGGLLRRKN